MDDWTLALYDDYKQPFEDLKSLFPLSADVQKMNNKWEKILYSPVMKLYNQLMRLHDPR